MLQLASCLAFCVLISLSFVDSLCTAAVIKHFDDFHEDQFDFHAYCIRKVTLRAYTDVLKFEDNLWGEDYYCTAAEGTIRIYLHLYDNPAIAKEDEEPDYSKMTAAERKKAKAIARKKKAQAEKKEAEKQKNESQNEDNGGGKTASKKRDKSSPIEEDPDGKELLKKDPLEEAKNYSAILSKHCPNRIGTWVLQYDVSIRRKKTLLALQALLKMKKLDHRSPEYISRLVTFALKMPSFEISGAVKTVVSEETANLLDGKAVGDFVTDLGNQARGDPTTSLPLRIAIAESLIKAKLESGATAAKIVVDGGINGREVNIESCRAALSSLKGFGSDASSSTSQWVSLVKERFPLIKNFS
jgi:peptide alpha-N-acetyltransferase